MVSCCFSLSCVCGWCASALKTKLRKVAAKLCFWSRLKHKIQVQLTQTWLRSQVRLHWSKVFDLRPSLFILFVYYFVLFCGPRLLPDVAVWSFCWKLSPEPMLLRSGNERPWKLTRNYWRCTKTMLMLASWHTNYICCVTLFPKYGKCPRCIQSFQERFYDHEDISHVAH